ncbi:MAG TPA: gluconokinase [Marisediminicola sp.]|jgi:carbohydrate kinase (thermoresistant glucokinase family)|nr:gluconokinase [Marisediminicola sp.]
MTGERMPQLVVMGVSGSGKSTVGALLAEMLNVRFLDGDSLHPASNVAKMAAGTALTDDDRWPWLAVVGQSLAGASETGLVVACSALKRSYRLAILAEAPDVRFVFLKGSRELLIKRLGERIGHFMPATLLDSQFATLEPLQDDEPGITVPIDRSPAQIAQAASSLHACSHQRELRARVSGRAHAVVTAGISPESADTTSAVTRA